MGRMSPTDDKTAETLIIGPIAGGWTFRLTGCRRRARLEEQHGFATRQRRATDAGAYFTKQGHSRCQLLW
jgi:hypothetical protein